MKYLYPIRRGPKDYHYGKTDQEEIKVENLCDSDCSHQTPIEASDCFRERLLKNKPTLITIQPRKCCTAKCANTTTEMLNFGYNFQFALCKDHRELPSVRNICGFGFPLLLKDFND